MHTSRPVDMSKPVLTPHDKSILLNAALHAKINRADHHYNAEAPGIDESLSPSIIDALTSTHTRALLEGRIIRTEKDAGRAVAFGDLACSDLRSKAGLLMASVTVTLRDQAMQVICPKDETPGRPPVLHIVTPSVLEAPDAPDHSVIIRLFISGGPDEITPLMGGSPLWFGRSTVINEPPRKFIELSNPNLLTVAPGNSLWFGVGLTQDNLDGQILRDLGLPHWTPVQIRDVPVGGVFFRRHRRPA